MKTIQMFLTDAVVRASTSRVQKTSLSKRMSWHAKQKSKCPRQVLVWQTCSRVHIKRLKHIKHISNNDTTDSQAPLHNTNKNLNGIQTHRIPLLRMLAWTGKVSSNWQRKRMRARYQLGALGMQRLVALQSICQSGPIEPIEPIDFFQS